MSTIVSGEGPLDASIMLIGQNPGQEEAEQGRPFVGRSGQYLDQVLKRNGVNRANLYITSVVKETTPANRQPRGDEISYWMPHLIEEIKRIKPKVIVLMGKVAQKTPRFEGIRYIETCHPAAAMRFPKLRKEFEKAFDELREQNV